MLLNPWNEEHEVLCAAIDMHLHSFPSCQAIVDDTEDSGMVRAIPTVVCYRWIVAACLQTGGELILQDGPHSPSMAS